MVETRMVEDPEFRNEVELTQAMRQGLRELQKRGEIAPLLSPRRAFWNAPRVALAASLATIAVGAASFLSFSRQDQAPAGAVTESLYFVTTRSSGALPDVTWRRPDAPARLELHFDVGLEPAAAYAVRIARARNDAAITVLETTAVTSADGEAILSLDGALLEPGDYELQLTAPTAAGATATYTLRVTRP